MKKFICILLTALLLFGMLSVCAYAEDTTTPSEEGSDIVPGEDPSTDSTDPSTDSTDPSTDSTDPSTDSTDPSTDSTDPSTDSTDPSTDSTDPSTDSTDPSTDSTEPSTDSTDPSTDSTDPSTDSTDPSTDTTDPSTDTTDPSSDSTDPSTDPTEPEDEPIIIPDDDGVKRAMITVPGIDAVTGQPVNLQVIVEAGGESAYLLTDEDGRAYMAGATAENYHIKLEYPIEGIPIISLKNANLTNGQYNALTIGGIDKTGEVFIANFPCIISVEADSTLTGKYDMPRENGSYSAIACKNGKVVTITGPGKLTLISEGMYPLMSDGCDLTFQDANVVAFSMIEIARGVRPAIWVKNGDIQIISSRIHASSNSGSGILISDSVSGVTEKPRESYMIAITNGSYVTISCPNSYAPAIGCNGDIGVYDSTLEITAKVKCFQPEPFLVNVIAVAGADKSSVTAYKEDKAFEYTYFRTIPTKPEYVVTEPEVETLPIMPETEPETVPETVPVTVPETLPQQNSSSHKQDTVILIASVALLVVLIAAEAVVVTCLVKRRKGSADSGEEQDEEQMEDVSEDTDTEVISEPDNNFAEENNKESNE